MTTVTWHGVTPQGVRDLNAAGVRILARSDDPKHPGWYNVEIEADSLAFAQELERRRDTVHCALVRRYI